MTNNDIEISKGGIKLSYLRFLSDSATGFTTILILYFHPLFRNYDIFLLNYTLEITGPEKYFLLILLVLLSTPLGLIINAFSWASLGWLNIRLEANCFDYFKKKCDDTKIIKDTSLNSQLYHFFITSTLEKYSFDECMNFYDIQKENWYSKSCLMKETLNIYYPKVLVPLEHVEGIINLVRSIALLLILYFILHFFHILTLFWINEKPQYVFIFISFILLILLLISDIIVLLMVSFYYNLSIFLISYLLCFRETCPDKNKKEFLDDLFKKKIYFLARTSDSYCDKIVDALSIQERTELNFSVQDKKDNNI